MKNKSGKQKNVRKVILSSLIVFGFYIVVCFAIVLIEFIHMVNQNRTATASDYGQSRYELLPDRRSP